EAALGDIGIEAALEIAIAEARDLFEKGHAQAGLQVTSEAEQGGSQGELQEQQGGDEERDGGGSGEALAGQAELAAQVEEAAEEHCLQQRRSGGGGHGAEQRGRGQEAIGAEEAE